MSSLYLGQEIKGEKKLLILKYFDMTKSEAYVNYWQYYSVKSQCGVVWTKQQMCLFFKKMQALLVALLENGNVKIFIFSLC